MNNRVKIIRRWESILRGKAGDYEHTDRAKGKDVTRPSLDDIANEMEAFLAGLVEIENKYE